MAISRDMQKFILQKKKKDRTQSGALKSEWIDEAEIDVAIYKSSETVQYASELYKESTHTGLTYRREIEAGKYRIKKGNVVYQILSCDNTHRLTNLLLKEVSTDV